MGRLTSSARRRRVLRVLALATLTIGTVATWALAAGPGGWDHLGDRGVAGTKSLNLVASALEVTPGALYVGGGFEDAGGIASADRIAKWDGSNWSAVSSSTSQFPANSRIDAIAVADGKVYAGGTFKNAGGKPDADHLAVWDGASWEPFCESVTSGPAFDDNVTSLQIIGSTLYVGGMFHNGGADVDADYLLACDLGTGASSAATLPGHFFSGPVYALTADSNDTLYAGGRFGNLENVAAADNVARLAAGGTWQAMGSGTRACGCAIDTFVRGLTAVGTDVYVGTDEVNIAAIPKADHVAKWNGSEWSALGANRAGDNGWLPTTTSINALAGVGQNLFVSGTFQDADGDARADNVAWFDGAAWHPVGSDGAGNGPWIGNGLALALFGSRIYATGSFTSAGGDPQAQYAASFAINQLIAVPTPTVTPGPGPVPTPTVTPSPTPPAPDVTPPKTRLRAAQINHAKRKATFRFASGEPGSKFLCKLDKKKYKPCTSPKTYKRLKPGKHVFRVKARDRAGNVDKTPMVKRFKIKRR